ncbi:MAG: tetratricopeptide repeat protein [Brasilonema sp.]
MNTENILESKVKYLIQIATHKHKSGQLDEAETIYRQILQTQSEHQIGQHSSRNPYLLVMHRLGDVLHKQGKFTEAIKLYKQTLTLAPDYAEAHNDLGSVFKDQGKLEAAVECYKQALSIKPDMAEAHNNLGNALKTLDLEAAMQSYQQAINIKPDWAEAHYNLATALDEQGQLEACVATYQQALNIQPDYAAARFGICMSQLLIIYSSVDEIQIRRNQYQHHLQKLAHYYQLAKPKEQSEAAKVVGWLQTFYLPYQGLNDRALQQTHGEMICRLMAKRYPQWSQSIPFPKLAANEKIRVGFVSGFFRSHSNWKIPIRGWVENLDRTEFELFGYHTDLKQDRETLRAAKAFDKFTQGPLLVEKWADLIEHDQLHILIFPEFGMDAITIQLGCLRLAPIQMTSWGHPVTSGLPTIDYYLSSDLMESENAQDHYTEKLVRLPNLSIHYTPLEIEPQAINRRDIGIADGEIMFWCCQSLYKYLPQYDDVFPRIAKALEKCKFVFIKHFIGEQVNEVFRERLRQAFEDFGLNYQDYCIFLPPMAPGTFAGTTAIADVFLDSIGWSGCNSTLEAIAHNIPIVTLPGDLMRGRHSMAILKMMGIEETIAPTKDDYVQIAVRLAQDAQYRQQISQQVAEKKQRLYGDLEPVRALEDFLLKVLNKPRRFAAAEVAQILQLAVQHHRANRLDNAQLLYRQVLEKQPDHPEALYSLGMLAQQLGQPQTAEQWLSAATFVQPDSVKTWFSLGNLRLAQEQYPEAVIAYRQALALRPDSLPIYNNLGYALQQQGLFDEAINCYQKALELKPDFIEAEANLGNALHAQGKLSSEKQLYYAQLNHKLGVARKKAGDLKTAVAYYRQAIAIQPDLVEAHYNLGAVLQEQGEQLQEAGAAYRQWLKLINPHYAKAVEADSDSAVAKEDYTTPPIPQREVIVGGYRFPAIPSVSEQEDKRPFWSVVIPVYNRTKYLLECLAGVLAQWPGEEEMEILVMDNASQTPVFEIVNSIGKGVVHYYRNPENLGCIKNMNAGIALSRGQWIHVIPDDDYVLPGFYSQLKQSLEGCSESIGAAFTGYENINEKEEVIFSQQVYGEYRGLAQNWLWKIGVSNPLNMSAIVIRRLAHEQLGGYLPELSFTPDWELYKRIAAFYDWWCEPCILARFRQHSQTITAEVLSSGTEVTCFREAIEISEKYLPAEHCAGITAKARSWYFSYSLELATIPLKTGNIVGALHAVQEALKLDQSSQAVANLFKWLTNDEAAPLREEIVSKLLLLKTNESSGVQSPTQGGTN